MVDRDCLPDLDDARATSPARLRLPSRVAIKLTSLLILANEEPLLLIGDLTAPALLRVAGPEQAPDSSSRCLNEDAGADLQALRSFGYRGVDSQAGIFFFVGRIRSCY